MRIAALLQKDVTDNNESLNRVLIVRLLCLMMTGYFLFLIPYVWPTGQKKFIVICFVFALIYGGILCLTYRRKSGRIFLLYSSVTTIWIIYCVLLLGWDCGVQHFIYANVVFVCFATLAKVRCKLASVAFFCIVRISLYFYARNYLPEFIMEDGFIMGLQLINTVFIFSLITIVAIFASEFSQKAEKKLLCYNRELEKIANKDELTGLINRRAMTRILEEQSMKSNGKYVNTIAIGDVDFFKQVNDRYGHECGDVVLKELSQLFQDEMMEVGQVARWGGEEFLFLFETLNGDEAVVYLFGILQKIRLKTFFYLDQEIKLTMTFGLEELNGNEYIHSLKKADQKLYQGKNMGRNQIIY